MKERTTTLDNAHFISVLNVLEMRLANIPRPAHVNRNSESGNVYQYFFGQARRSEDKDLRRGRVSVGYSRTTIRPGGKMVVDGYPFDDQIVFECYQVQEGREYTVAVKGYYPLQYESTIWIKLIFDGIWADMLQAFKPKPEKKSPKSRKSKSKIPNMPTLRAHALRWVFIWELIGPKIDEDSSLENNYHELREWLKTRTDKDMGDDTLRKIIKRGRAGKIPSLVDFERVNRM